MTVRSLPDIITDMENINETIQKIALYAMSMGGTWAAEPGAKPARKRYAVKNGRVVRRPAPGPFTDLDVVESPRRIEVTRDGADLVIVSY